MKIREYIQVKPTVSTPDPATYCPANGYIPDPEVFQPPFPMPEFPVESITFICNAATGNWDAQTRNFKLAKTGAGNYLYELFDTGANLLDSWTSSVQYMNFAFPTNDCYYVLRISVTGGTVLTQYFNNDGSVTPYFSCIEQVIFNTPNLSGTCFRGNKSLVFVDFQCSLDSMTSMWAMFENCTSVHFFKPKSSYPALTAIYQAFKGSGIRILDLSNTSMPNIALADNMFCNCLELTEVYFPAAFYGTRFYDSLSGTRRLRKLQLFTSAPNMGTSGNDICYLRAFQNSSFEGEITLPECQYAANMSNIFENCAFVTKIKFEGIWPAITYLSSAFYGCSLLEDIELPRTAKATGELSGAFNTANTAIKY
jgi:hypothetical protein